MMTNPPKVFIFGLGYTGLAFAKACHEKGWWVGGTCQTEEKQSLLQQQRLNPLLFDSTAAIQIPPDTTHLLSTIGTDDALIDTVLHFHQQQIESLTHLQWLGYLSATSVYGDYQGMWVSETAPLRPTTERGQLRMKAEQRWQHLNANIAAHIFRLAGIYGPGRNVLESLKEGKARRIIKPAHVFSRIHVDDIVHILLRSIDQPQHGEIFNCADDEPSSTNEIIEYLCEKYPLALPKSIPFDDPALPQTVRSYYLENRRISNDKIKRLLGVTLEYPSYQYFY